ncbi:MAG: hypothetical protein LWW85_11610, partial [Marinilabiliales bacterium]|nr:hypothetical protein [Marinilabiliales bacterium]
RITELHDYATLFVDGKYIGKIDRSKGENSIDLPAAISSDPLLEILVEGMGRVNFAEYLIDRKGITDRVTLNGMTLMNWEIVNLPMEEGFLKNLTFDEKQTTRPGLFFKGSFELDKTGDTYLDVSKWEKGIAWINGHNLGRYWSIGPQKRLYCPASWLNKGSNEVILFDQHCLSARTICGVTALEP